MLAATTPSQAAPAHAGSAGTAPVALTQSAAPRLPQGAVRLGTLAPDTKISFEVTLNVRDQAALTAFLNGVEEPGSPFYQQFLRPGQFGPRFGLSLAQVAAVEHALRSAGLSPGQASSDRLSIPVTATASAIEHAFGITLDSYRLPSGRDAYANAEAPRIAAAVAPLVQGVVGLDDLYLEQHMDALPAAPQRAIAKVGSIKPAATPGATGPQPCSAATGSGANTANIFAGHYGMNLLYLLGDLGRGARIAVLELEPNLPSDITAYEQCYGIHTKVNYIAVDGGAGSGAGSGEAALDIETIAGLAPDATIDVYQSPLTAVGFVDIFQKYTSSDTDKVISVSWASCEANDGAAFQNAMETEAEKANAQGQAIFAAAGDTGSTSCANASTNTTAVTPTIPAAAPYVTGVGGTSFEGSGNSQQEIVWNDSSTDSGAGGGGVSSYFCMPGYQHQTRIPGIVNRNSRKDTSRSCASKYYREVPDITADGDPFYGYAYYYDGGWVLGGVGGTSAATPLWASIAGLTEVSPFCSAYGSRGAVLPQNLYNAVATYHSYVYGSTQVVHDITIGNNDYTPSGYTGGLYPAGKGYDMASGLGAPMVSGEFNNRWYVYLAGLTQVLCHQSATRLKTVKVTSVTPRSGRAGKSIKVTVRGSGFLPISSADEAQIIFGNKVLATVDASCSTTVCTLTLPAESAKTVYIKIFADSLWSSPKTLSSRFTY
jgi:subtilase family serine protease